MLPKPKGNQYPTSARLHGRTAFLVVRTKGKRTRSMRLGLMYLTTESHLRVGIAIPRKVGSAPVRNRSKRLLREYIRHHWTDLPDTGSMLITIFRAIETWDTSLSLEVEQLLRKLNNT